MRAHFVRFEALCEVIQYPVHDCGVLDAGNDLDRSAALAEQVVDGGFVQGLQLQQCILSASLRSRRRP